MACVRDNMNHVGLMDAFLQSCASSWALAKLATPLATSYSSVYIIISIYYILRTHCAHLPEKIGDLR